ncbi:DUF1289 domain-containing protein [Methylobacillus gramineus]|uniref:DUF1289 domain-containing protein n=1 Tax=Methylobacillus gramineus TaxID=755169 RepID=UPI001CFF6923|nr:DUF1289 domain-containing protein [Methylobacillus gramineus]MCB5186242.1 DUF1289 domain-containing protein [Methylobacillus gramineus]
MTVVASPCVGVCVIGDEHGFCEGCFRTIDEIRAWRTMENGERQQVLDKVTEREAALLS